MSITVPTIAKLIGAGLATYLWIHYLDMPFGLIAGVATALLVLP